MSVGLLSGRDAQTVLLCRKLGWTGQAERIIRMEQRILQYRKFMDEELLRLSKEQNVTEEEISRIKKEHLVQISLFQHERLVYDALCSLSMGNTAFRQRKL